MSRAAGAGTVGAVTPSPRIFLAVAAGALALLLAARLAEITRLAYADSLVVLSLLALGVELVLGLTACAGALLSRAPFDVRLGLGASRLRARSLALLILGMLALSHGLDAILELSGLREESALAGFAERLHGARGGALWLALVGLVVAPSIAEELLCRGFLQRGLQRRLGAPAAIGISALVFGVLHIEPVHALFAAVLGLYLGVAARWADSTRASIGCHLVNNLASVGMMVAFRQAQPAPALSIPLAFAVCLGCLWEVSRDKAIAGARGTADALD
ncbi:MAG TPA: CPBP family intramembrane glutamic endopeptidase [Myxococcota bacterium]